MKHLLLLTILSLLQTNHANPVRNSTLQEKYGEALNAIFGMGIRLQAFLQDHDSENPKNFLVSPLSAALIIGQLMLGAEGEFREQLYNLLSLPDEAQPARSAPADLPESPVLRNLPYSNLHFQLGGLVRKLKEDAQKSYQLDTSSALFHNTKYALERDFKNYLFLYETDVYGLNFTEEPRASRDFINKWGYAHTNGLISETIQGSLPPSTAAIFANSIYFKGDWETPFNDIFNNVGPFHVRSDKTVNVTYMYRFIEDIYYGYSKKYQCKIINLPYKKEELGMYIILPHEDHKHAYNINKFVQEVKLHGIQELLNDLQKHDVDVRLPKMTLHNSMSILEPLKKYSAYMETNKNKIRLQTRGRDNLQQRVEDYLSYNKSDNLGDIYLTNAVQHRDLPISDIVQQMIFAVNEKGTEAAAISAGILDYMGASKVFTINRPFVFFIRHEDTSTVLFWGTISDPSLC